MTDLGFEQLARDGFEELTLLHDRRSSLLGCLAVHDTSAGPAFGGIRRWSYRDEREALRDCLRLARAMTHKCALADLPAGGAKAVVLDRAELDLPQAYRHLGDHVERMAGRFYTGPDVGTGVRELAWVAERTRFVTHPGPEGPGELPEATCAGVVAGMEAALRHLDGEVDWSRRTVVIQGLGEVGARVAAALRQRGARVRAAEVDPARAAEAARRLELELLDPAGEYDSPCDVFSPCALGGGLHDLTVQRLRCRIVAGAANNVLASEAHAERLHARGILYVPDFVINAGALVRGAAFHLRGLREDVEGIGQRIGARVERILSEAREAGIPPAQAAWREAERRLRARRADHDRRPCLKAVEERVD